LKIEADRTLLHLPIDLELGKSHIVSFTQCHFGHMVGQAMNVFGVFKSSN